MPPRSSPPRHTRLPPHCLPHPTWRAAHSALSVLRSVRRSSEAHGESSGKRLLVHRRGRLRVNCVRLHRRRVRESGRDARLTIQHSRRRLPAQRALLAPRSDAVHQQCAWEEDDGREAEEEGGDGGRGGGAGRAAVAAAQAGTAARARAALAGGAAVTAGAAVGVVLNGREERRGEGVVRGWRGVLRVDHVLVGRLHAGRSRGWDRERREGVGGGPAWSDAVRVECEGEGRRKACELKAGRRGALHARIAHRARVG